MFAKKYLSKQNKPALINTLPSQKLGISVIIPCLREPEILNTLQSVLQCDLPKSEVEVIVLINHSEIADKFTREENVKTKQEIDSWISENKNSKINFHLIGPVALKKKWAGAGVARKMAMDEAVRRFDIIDKPNGILVSLDADTLVEKNYLVEIEKHFQKNKSHVGATILFEHQKENLKEKHLQGITLYENYLWYYKNALEFCGYPFSMFTVGSAFAVTAEAYVKRGGMNRRQAGEDFYFLQGLVQIGKVGEINSTKVYPSARLSNRVPFGTGPILQKWLKGEEDLTRTYNFNAFADLKNLFSEKGKLFKLNESEFYRFLEKLPHSVSEFIKTDNFWTEINDLNKNCSNINTFNGRFFQKFNAFKILKFLNYAHENFYEKADLNQQIKLLKQNYE